MEITFYKYQGTGNDFVVIDDRQLRFPQNDAKRIAKLCDRRFGIGADGLILLQNDDAADFKMVYFNSDGNQSTMCGNGGRCIVAFARDLGLIENETTFIAIDGLHHAVIQSDTVTLQMQDVQEVQQFEAHTFVDTGSPHHVQLVDGLDRFDVKQKGAKIRYGAPYYEVGSNVNFVEKISEDIFAVRTYERGVEGETLSCGTGVTAVAIAMFDAGETGSTAITLNTEGGRLQVTFEPNGIGYKNVHLRGEAKKIYQGSILC